MFQCISFRSFDPKPVVLTFGGYVVRKRLSRDWEVFDADGKLICITVYKRGALEVVRRLLAHSLQNIADSTEDIDDRRCSPSAKAKSRARKGVTKAKSKRSVPQKRRSKPAGAH